MYIYLGVSVYCKSAPESVVLVCVCVISNQSTSKKPYYVSDFGKLNTLLHKTYIKVLLLLRYRGSAAVYPYYH